MIGRRRATVVQMGARNKYLVASFLHQHGILEELHTDIWLRSNHRKWIQKASQINRSIKRYENRYNQSIPDHKVIAYPRIGFEYLLKRSWNSSTTAYVRNELDATKRFLRDVSNHLRHYDGIIYSLREALEVFDSADHAFKIMEEVSAIGIYRNVLKNENSKWSGWETLSTEDDDALWNEILEREKKSYIKSNIVVVPSEWVKNYLLSLGINGEKIRVTPYWCPTPPDVRPKIFNGSRNLRILFVGRVNLAKGIPYLLEALSLFKTGIEVAIIGEKFLDLREFGKIPSNVKFISHSPFEEVDRLYRWADLYVFPTLCEGSSLSVYEALAYGLPIITTPNCGSMVSHESEGFIIPPSNSEAIAAHIHRFLDSPSMIELFSHNSLKLARSNTIDHYRGRLLNIFSQIEY